MESGVLQEALAQKDWIVELRRQLHLIPELCYQEIRTSELVRQTLEQLGISYRYPISETGIIADLGSGAPPCVALRADMDGLPIEEATELPFRSQHAGRMHACGHDSHVAMLLGAARLLKQRDREIHGTVRLVFQPAEEGGAGGRRMCEEGALDNPTPERMLGLHVWPQLQTGFVGGRIGTLLAAASSFVVSIEGAGGHAALPHLSVDPVMTASKIVCELQTIVSREIDPLEAAVVSVTAIEGGDAFNVIPARARLQGTLRSLTSPGLTFLRQRVNEMATQIAMANRCRATVDFVGHDYPPTANHGGCWTVLQRCAVALLGSDRVVEMAPIMGAEDFGYYAERVPACFAMVGIRNENLGSVHGVHSPHFKLDEDALPVGTALHVIFALESLAELRRR